MNYAVCATPRSGSTLLCQGLKATGVAGRPEEYFEAVPATGRPRVAADYLDGLDDPEVLGLLGSAPLLEPPEYSTLLDVSSWGEHLARVRVWGTTPNGVFAAKLMWGHLLDLPASPAELFGELRYVWVRRHDKVRQAISLWRAMQTQSWRDEGGSGGGEPQYSFSALRHLVALLSSHDAEWERWLAGEQVLELSYDEIAADLPRTLERALAHIDIPLPESWPPSLPPMRRQADELSDAWCGAYARDLTGDPSPR
jgi:trehalose 2-sulfotransferase